MGRNFLDLCNEVINLMSYLPAKTMDDLNNAEGRLIKQKMNEVLRELCGGEKDIWKFREREKTFFTYKEQSEYELPEGYILFIRPEDSTNRPPLIYNQQWRYLPLSASGQPVYYWIYKNKIRLFPTPDDEQDGDEYTIKYLTDNFAVDKDGCEKDILEDGDDEPIIPEMYRSLLVYGVVRDFRASSNDAKSDFYRRKYNALYSKMLSNQRLTDDYFVGGKVLGNKNNTLEAKISAFKNPYATGDVGKRV